MAAMFNCRLAQVSTARDAVTSQWWRTMMSDWQLTATSRRASFFLRSWRADIFRLLSLARPSSLRACSYIAQQNETCITIPVVCGLIYMAPVPVYFIFGAFDFFHRLWIYRCCWSWLAFSIIPITAYVPHHQHIYFPKQLPLTVAGKNINCNCKFCTSN